MPILHCEGPVCNAGLDAHAREATLTRDAPSATAELRDEAAKHARSMVSRQLAVTPHVRCGIGRHGTVLFACRACGHKRVYGTTMWATGL